METERNIFQYLCFLLSIAQQCGLLLLLSWLISYFFDLKNTKVLFLKIAYFVFSQYPFVYISTMPFIIYEIKEKRLKLPIWYLSIVNILGILNLFLSIFSQWSFRISIFNTNTFCNIENSVLSFKTNFNLISIIFK